MKARLDELGAAIIGGNLARSDRFFISVTAAGTCVGEPMRRSGAHPGDLAVVTGALGGARVGLELMKNRKIISDHPLARRHIAPPVRIEEGILLREIASACIDISDGLLQDLGHIVEESGVGATIEAEKIPLVAGEAGISREEALLAALTGGEDYELLAAVPPESLGRIDEIERKTGTPFTVIGKFTHEKHEIRAIDKNGEEIILPESKGWDHFAGR